MTQTFRGSSLPYLLMTPEQRAQSQQLEFGNSTTLHFDCCNKSKEQFKKILNNHRNLPLVYETIRIMDSVLGIIKGFPEGIPIRVYNQALIGIKAVHDNLQKIGALQDYEKVLEGHLDTIAMLYRKSIQEKQPTTVKQMDPDEFHDEPTQVANPTNEGMDYHLSRAYYDRRAKKWIQRKVKNVDTAAEKEREKENIQMQREEFRSFKKFFSESELNTTSRLQADGDVVSKDEDGIYVDKSKKVKPKFKVSVNTQSDPLSS